ncbi:MAG: hypothetical protein EXS25_12815 [Pedosphaera sp.]|nr:hypothetical protein [Pedosphaera sp.]
MTSKARNRSLRPGRCLTFRAPPAALFDRRLHINLSVALADLLIVCQRLFPSAILIKPVLSSFSLLATVDPSIMDQIFMNLFVNARDAMSSGGSLTVESALIETIPGTVLPPGIIRHGRFARFTITDTGCGMSDETLQRLQEPFFTTKPIGKGTGIGLSSVRRSIEVHGGWMTIQSTIGIGSTFIVILPLDVSIYPKRLNLGDAKIDS